MKKLATVFFALILSLSALPAHAIDIRLNGEKIPMETPPALQNNRTMVSISAVASALGGTAQWNNETREVLVTRDNSSILLKIGSSSATINGSSIALDAPPVIFKGRTMVPLSIIASAFGEKVRWDAAAQTVFIGSALSSPEEISSDPGAQALVSFMTAYRNQNFDPASLNISQEDALLLPNLNNLDDGKRSILLSQLTTITYHIMAVAPQDFGSNIYLRLEFSDLGGVFFNSLLASQNQLLQWASLDDTQRQTLLLSMENSALSATATSAKKAYAEVKVSMRQENGLYRIDLKNSPAFCNALWGNLLSYK